MQNPSGKAIELGISTTNAYTFTAESALASVARVLKGDLKPGAITPSRAFGADFVLQIAGVEKL